ncbi:MAG: DUF1579 family protein [Planctomycetes bacterium]|nr:DUF1579 family protein [Planctomycetota bacterium]
MEMPKPGKEQAKLAIFEGVFEGPEKLYPTPYMPEGGTRTGTMRAKMTLGGFFLEIKYVQKDGRKKTYEGLGMAGFDPKNKSYTMAWFDEMGGGTDAPSTGTVKGKKLQVSSKEEHGTMRYTWTLSGENTMKFLMELGTPDGQWAKIHTGTYTRK